MAQDTENELGGFSLEELFAAPDPVGSKEDGKEIPAKDTDKKASVEKDEEEDTDDSSEDGSGKDTDNVSTEDNEEAEVWSSLYTKMFSDYGWGTYDPENGPEPSFEGFQEFIKGVVEANTKNRFASEEVAKFNDYIANGGDPKEFINVMYSNSSLEDLDMEDEDNQEKVVTQYLQKKYPKKDSTWIKARVERLKETEMLEDEALTGYEELLEEEKLAKKRIEEETKQAEENRKKQYAESIKSLKSIIDSSQDFGGFPVKDKERQEFFDYLTKQDIKTKKTKYQQELEEDENSALVMAWLKFKKFNIETANKTVETKLAKDLKKKLSNYTDAGAKGGGSKAGENTARNKTDYNDFVLPL